MLLLPILVTMENTILVLVRYKRLLQYSLHLFQIRCIWQILIWENSSNSSFFWHFLSHNVLSVRLSISDLNG